MTSPATSTPESKKPTTKKPTVKKPGAAKPAKKAQTSEVFARWKAGARISELVKTFKLFRPQVRRQLLEGAGSRESFKVLRKHGAGGTLATSKKAVTK